MRSLCEAASIPIVVTEDSDVGIKGVALMEAIYGLHYWLSVIEKDIFVSGETSTAALDKHADAKLEGGRKGSTYASGTDALTITGTNGSTFAAGESLTGDDGTEYELASGGTIASGTATADVVATTRGSAGNRAVGDTLTFNSPPSGIDAAATIAVAMTDGEDAETDGELAKRLLDAYRNPPAGGRMSDYRQWATAVEGVYTAYVYGPSRYAQNGRRGLGIVDVAILGRGSGSARVPSTTVADNVDDAIYAKRPATVKEHSVLRPTAVTQAVEAVITPFKEYQYDWEKQAAVTVDAATTDARTIIVDDEIADFATSARPLKAGSRVLIAGELATVKSVTDNTPSAKATVVLTADLVGGTPSGGDSFWPAGPLTAAHLAVVQKLFDQLGPARGESVGSSTSAADGGYDREQTGWDDTLRLNALHRALRGGGVLDLERDDNDKLLALGVQDATISTPSANVEPDDNALTTGDVEFLIAGELTIRPALTT
ncbi:MAG: baseplate J/gp47 family protein [Myxococcales bacterium]|nr:baseplate J/gp47 family protein [Myxococcales bacterium]